MKRINSIKASLVRGLRLALLVSLSTTITISEAALLTLADSPVYLLTPVDPNVLLSFDDSGSMQWSFLPDTVSGNSNTNRACSSTYNRIYFDPTVTYTPPVREDGVTPLNNGGGSPAPATFTSAYRNGYQASTTTVVNLSTNYRPSWGSLTPSVNCNTAGVPGSAFYYTYDSTCGNVNSDACYTLVRPIPAAQEENFANWYSYYRNRNSMAKSAAGRAFSRFGTNIRIAGQHLNSTGGSTGSSAAIFPNSFGAGQLVPFSGTNRADFFTRLYNSPADDWTPLREAMMRAGEYLTTADPYRDSPGDTTSPERSCRQNFHILMTDGYWNGPGAPIVTGDHDGTAVTLPDSTAYPTAGMAPYSDSWTSTLADAAFYYWATDLRGAALTNNVRTNYTITSGSPTQNYWNPVNDPANWQHMVNFTIGLGIDGTLVNDTATYNNLVAGSTSWPDPITNTQGERIDDLWHAAINSRGLYFSAGNPTQLVTAFTSIINNVVGRISSASSVSLNTGSLSGNNYVYQSRFNSGDWTGQLLAYPISSSTRAVGTSSTWDAAVQLNGQHFNSGRQIITYNPTTRSGAPFRWASLDTNQTAALNYNPITATSDGQGAARLDYLRGDASNEGAGNNYRVRTRMCGALPCPPGTNTGVLGDTVNSAPLFVSTSPYDYPASLETSSYKTFRDLYAGRTPIIYVGGNDGMLHGFDADTGRENIAYVPSKVYSNLSRLAHTPYSHKYFVDGNPMAGDAFISGTWRTILVGGLRNGGKGIYALDITDPSRFTEANANAATNPLVLWEFTDNNDPDLGYTFSEPSIVKMRNGKWAVIFGNGYNNSEADGTPSANGHAVLYILFIEDGKDGVWSATDFVKIDTGVGSAGTPNGLATPAVVDIDSDYIADYIYAGDLQGNMWKFDVTNTNPSNWNNPGNLTLVFAAGSQQPITSRPQVRKHPAGQAGYMVYFGTGKYLEPADASTAGATTQTFYGIWDGSGVANPNKTDLLQQTVLSTSTSQFRVISNNPMIWRVGTPVPSPSYIGWYLDLPTTGERQVTNSILRGDRIIFTTLVPSNDPCSAGGDGWLMEINPSNGGRLDTTPFDVNGDGIFSSLDLIGGNTVGGQKMSDGIPAAPGIIPRVNPSVPCTGSLCSQEQKATTNTGGGITTIRENPECSYCRAGWRQAR